MQFAKSTCQSIQNIAINTLRKIEIVSSKGDKEAWSGPYLASGRQSDGEVGFLPADFAQHIQLQRRQHRAEHQSSHRTPIRNPHRGLAA
jgi:hypothetical protein